MRFTTASGIEKTAQDDWFDLVLNQDTPLYIDPYLLFEDEDPRWSGALEEVVEFFEVAARFVLASGGNENTAAWRKAVRLLRFPEPHEFALGVSLGSPRGSGTGVKFARRIAAVLGLVGESRVSNLASIGGFALFCEGLGVDRISDILSNILKARFLDYTREVNERHGVTTASVPVKHVSWSGSRGAWLDKSLNLFPNPSTGGGALLVPERFLKDIPRIEPEGFWNWAQFSEAAELRDNLNFDLSESLTKSEKVRRARELAWAHPDAAFRYVERVGAEEHHPYNLTADHDRRVGWLEDGQAAAVLVRDRVDELGEIETPDQFNTWVLERARDFQYVVEQTDAWRLLWDRDIRRHVREPIAQALASVMWRERCKVENIDLGKEVDLGRGPVDFKFSQGWNRRALLEIKYIESSHFSSGAAKQLPQYLRTEGIAYGVYLAIGFKDADFQRTRVRLVEDTCKAISDAKGIKIEPILVDARPKQSASKL